MNEFKKDLFTINEKIFLLTNDWNEITFNGIQIDNDKILKFELIEFWKQMNQRPFVDLNNDNILNEIFEWIEFYWNSKECKIFRNQIIIKLKNQIKSIQSNLFDFNNDNNKNENIKKFLLFYRWDGNEYSFNYDYKEKLYQWQIKDILSNDPNNFDKMDELFYLKKYFKYHYDIILWKLTKNPNRDFYINDSLKSFDLNFIFNDWYKETKLWISKQDENDYKNHIIRFIYLDSFKHKYQDDLGELIIQGPGTNTFCKPFFWNIISKTMWTFDDNISSFPNDSKMEVYKETFYSIISKFMQIFNHEKKTFKYFSSWICSREDSVIPFSKCLKYEKYQKNISNLKDLSNYQNYNNNEIFICNSFWIYGSSIETHWKSLSSWIEKARITFLEKTNSNNGTNNGTNDDLYKLKRQDWNQIYFQTLWFLCECNRWGIQMEQLTHQQIFIETFTEKIKNYYKLNEFDIPFVLEQKHHIWIDFGVCPYSKWGYWKIPAIWRNINYSIPEEDLKKLKETFSESIYSPDCFKNTYDFYIYSSKRTSLIWILFLQSIGRSKFQFFPNVIPSKGKRFNQLCLEYKNINFNDKIEKKVQDLYTCSDLSSLTFIGFEMFSKYDIEWVPNCEMILNTFFKNWKKNIQLDNNSILKQLPCFSKTL